MAPLSVLPGRIRLESQKIIDIECNSALGRGYNKTIGGLQ